MFDEHIKQIKKSKTKSYNFFNKLNNIFKNIYDNIILPLEKK
jgi:hypothetical protein